MKRFLITMIVAGAASLNPLSAQEILRAPSGAKVDIVHEPILASELPPPGTLITLRVKLTNTRDTERRMRTLVVRDGRLTDVPPIKSFLDEYDQPTYEIPVFSPLAEISYQFMLQNADGKVTTSQRYTLRRSCIPRVDTSGLKLEGSQGEDRINALVKTAEGLAREVQSYDSLQKLVDELSQTLAQ